MSSGSTPAHRAKTSVTSRAPGRVEQQVGGAALGDRPVEEPGSRGHGEQRQHAAGAGRLAEDGDPLGVATEGGDVVTHPFQGGHLIEEPDVGGGRRVVEDHEAEGAEAVVDRDHDRVGGGRQPGAVVDAERPRAQRVGPAVDPHHHRSGPVVGGGGPDVQRQAVVALVGAAHAGHEAVEGPTDRLPGGRPVARGVALAVPGGGGGGGSPAEIAGGRGGEGHAEERRTACCRRPPDDPVRGRRSGHGTRQPQRDRGRESDDARRVGPWPSGGTGSTTSTPTAPTWNGPRSSTRRSVCGGSSAPSRAGPSPATPSGSPRWRGTRGCCSPTSGSRGCPSTC